MTEEKVVDHIRWTWGSGKEPIPAMPMQVITIAQMIQEGVKPEHFDTVFHAIMQVRYYAANNIPYMVAINQVMDKTTADRIVHNSQVVETVQLVMSQLHGDHK